MKAPEKIFIHPDIGGREFLRPWLHRPANNESVEYTRTDAFIEKAAEWLRNYINPTAGTYLFDEDIEKFINYMKGEEV